MPWTEEEISPEPGAEEKVSHEPWTWEDVSAEPGTEKEVRRRTLTGITKVSKPLNSPVGKKEAGGGRQRENLHCQYKFYHAVNFFLAGPSTFS